MSTDSRRSALAESALVAGLIWGLHALMRALGAPVALGAMATILTLFVCTWLLHRRATSWNSLGMGRITHYGRTVAWSLGLFVVQMVVPALLTGPVANALGLQPQRMDAFAHMHGNLAMYLVMLIPVGWGVAAFGEEMVYRGFIFRRLMYAFGGKFLEVAAALVSQTILFAIGHLYLGPRGVLNAGMVGLISGGAYLANGRTLWPLIIAHGLVDSVGLTALYLGVAHG